MYTLKIEEQPYRELVEAMNEGALTTTSEGIILYCNAKFDSMMKEPTGKLIGLDFSTFACVESKSILKILLHRSKKKPSTAEIFLNVADQLALPVKLSVSSIKIKGLDGFCIIATDLSEQKQNAIIFQQQEWLAALLNSLPVPLVVLNSDLKGFSFINVKATEILQEMKPIVLLFENEKEEALSISELLVKISENKTAGIETILSTGLRKIPILLFFEKLPAMYGRKATRLMMFQDISVIKKTQRDLSLTLQARDQFLAALSHELRTPINVILGWIELLRTNNNDKKMQKQGLETLARNAELQRDLIEDLLDISRIITGHLSLQLNSLNLKKSVQDSVMSLRPKAKEKNIELTIELDAEEAIVLADDKRIQQLICNLVQNSIKFTPKNGKIIVKVQTNIIKMTASINVQDTGQGISEEFLPAVFDQFKQENMSTYRAYGGLGLGLAICKTIVDQHKGSIVVESGGRDKGATFKVSLPLFMNEEVIKNNHLLKEESFDLKGIKVLLVDDSQDNLALFSIWLKNSGAEVKTLESASIVVEIMSSFKPDVLLSDISMPHEDGYSLIKKVRALANEDGGLVPAAALTANARIEDRELTLAAGFQLHIPKPVTCSGLISAVRLLIKLGRDNK